MAEVEIKVKSLYKALEILNCFVKKPRLGVTELSEMLDLNKSNVHNILTTFKAMDYVEQDEESGKYCLGVGIFQLCQAAGDRFSIRSIAMPFMQEIADMTGEMVYLAVPHEDEVIYLEAIYPVESFNLMRVILGERARMFCTGIGKAMLANMPIQIQEEYISRPLPSYTENTITDQDELRRELARIREKGYAVDNMEHEFGVKCVAMPLFGRKGTVEGAISVSGPSLRFSEKRILEIVEIMRNRVEKIKVRL
ncbi:MAG: IclR family transcriptional regulator [Eubacteriales bacterium]|nr:IclR family transcriptional regulator [Eubacteriales bacterium]